MRFKSIIKCILIFYVLSVVPVYAEYLELKNRFIKLSADPHTGRFAVQTTGGDPKLKTDQNSFLLYNDKKPTSFTTIRIDERNYKFGSKKGVFIKTMHKYRNSLRSIWKIRDIEITQDLKLMDGPTSGNQDMVEIKYHIKNNDAKDHNVGLRIMLDTYLGEEDGAPFRIPNKGPIVTETMLKGESIPTFWYAYDSLVDAKVRAQGIIKKKGVLFPDRVIWTSWSRFEKLWDFPIEKDRSFGRSGLGPRDSAMALYWDTKPMHPGEFFQAQTYYGLYNLTVNGKDMLQASLSGPVMVPEDPFVVTADIQAVSTHMIKDIELELLLPEGLEFSFDEQSIKKFNSLDPNHIIQASWKVMPGEVDEGSELCLRVSGKLENRKVSLEVKRDIKSRPKEINLIDELSHTDLNIETSEEGIKIDFDDVFFKYNKADLTDGAKEVLDKIGMVLLRCEDFFVRIYGHTDNIGSKEYNKKLSERRAKNVFQYFINKHYLDETNGLYQGFGMENPVADNNTEEGRKKNRRVEIYIDTDS